MFLVGIGRVNRETEMGKITFENTCVICSKIEGEDLPGWHCFPFLENGDNAAECGYIIICPNCYQKLPQDVRDFWPPIKTCR